MPDHHNKGNQHASKPAEDRAAGRVTLRVNMADKVAWVKQAHSEGMKLSQWIVNQLNSATK